MAIGNGKDVTVHGRCPLCGGDHLVKVLDREAVPCFQNVSYASQAAALAAPSGTLHIRACRQCGFTMNAAFDPAKLVYDGSYENNQAVSDGFRAHMTQMARRVLAPVEGQGGAICEVGCGQGQFLALMRALADNPAISLRGFDPSWRNSQPPLGVSITAEIFSKKAMELGSPPDVVVSRHVIEHIADPLAFLRSINQALPDDRACTLFIETPAFEWIIENSVIQDVFFEHVNYFTKETLTFALLGAGFRDVSVEAVFDGQYLFASAVRGAAADVPLPCNVPAAVDHAVRYGAEAERTIAAWRRRLSDRIPTAIWGAGAKGVTFAQLVDPAAKLIEVVVDINPAKQGGYIGGTGHPILAPQQAAGRIRRFLVMNRNYLGEIERLLATLGAAAELVVADEPAACL